MIKIDKRLRDIYNSFSLSNKVQIKRSLVFYSFNGRNTLELKGQIELMANIYGKKLQKWY